MKFHARWKKYHSPWTHIYSFNEGDPNAGGGGDGNPPPAGDAGGDGGSNGDSLNPWAQPSNINNGSDGDGGGNNSQQQQQQPGDSANQLRAHLDSQNFMQGVDLSGALTAFQENDIPAALSSISGTIQQAVENAYMAGIRNTAQLMDGRIEKAMEKQGEQVRGQMQGDMGFNQLLKQAPHLGDEHFRPVAKSTFNGFLKQTGDVDSAVQKTLDWSKKFAEGFGAKFSANDNKGPIDSGPSGGRPNSSTNDDTDWVAELTTR